MWEITRYIKDKTQLSKEYILPEFCIIDHWSEHPTPCSSLVNQNEIQYLKKKDTVFYYTSEYNICMALHVLENSSENQNVALHDWKFTKLNRISF